MPAPLNSSRHDASARAGQAVGRSTAYASTISSRFARTAGRIAPKRLKSVALLNAGVPTFLEFGPGQGLSEAIRETVDAAGATVVAASPRAASEVCGLLESVARLWIRGASADRSAAFAGRAARTVGLPTYAFQRRKYWIGDVGEVPAEPAG